MSNRTISENSALFVLEQWYGKPVEEQVRFRAFCFQAGLFGDDFKYVNNIKRVADCHNEPMKYIQTMMSTIVEDQEQEQEQSQEEDGQDEVTENEVTEDEVVENEVVEDKLEVLGNQNQELLDVVVVRQGFTNMLLILLILVTSPFLAYNVMHLYNRYFRSYETIYLVLDTPDVIYL